MALFWRFSTEAPWAFLAGSADRDLEEIIQFWKDLLALSQAET
jgi:hypothetical protein